jgi:hypothetical protein
MALGLAVSTLLGYGQGRLGWPWPAGSCAAFVLVLFAVAAGCARRLAVTVGVLTGVGVVLPTLFTRSWPSTLGTFLRAFTFGQVRQLDRRTEQLLQRACGPPGRDPVMGR